MSAHRQQTGLTDPEFAILRQAGLSVSLTSEVQDYAERVRWAEFRRALSNRRVLVKFCLAMIGFYLLAVWGLGLNSGLMAIMAWSPLIVFALWRSVLTLFGRKSAWKRSILGHAIAASRHRNLDRSWDFRHLKAMAEAVQQRGADESEADAVRGYIFHAFRAGWIVLPTVVICLGPGVLMGLVSLAQ